VTNFKDKPDWWKKAVEDHIKQFGATDPLPMCVITGLQVIIVVELTNTNLV
jgi:hypothetical protein